jgi:hypothetical protein
VATVSDGDLVWYVAYGSNVDRTRLETYLLGDRHRGAASTHDGARDPRPPQADAPNRLDLEVFFAGRSTRWEGAVAYCGQGTLPGAGPVLGRRWLLHRSQLEDLVRQENRHPGPVTVDPLHCRRQGHLDVVGGRYGRVLWLGEVDGVPAMTATCGRPVTPDGPAGVAYLRTIARGLAQCWDLELDEIARYLAERRGNAGHHDIEVLTGELAGALG